jgi:hypothetical protein
MEKVNTAVSSICLAALLSTGAAYFWGAARARHKRWRHRTKRAVVLHGVEICLQLSNAVSAGTWEGLK